MDALAREGLRVFAGATWTTDAPFRETAGAIAHARAAGVLAVEMEAAALYAFARARAAPVLCLAHVTNAMGRGQQDFEKGEGTAEADQPWTDYVYFNSTGNVGGTFIGSTRTQNLAAGGSASARVRGLRLATLPSS